MELLIACGVFGLIIGSFLNVVIYRLPIMLKRQWRYEAHEILQLKPPGDNTAFNLIIPRSHCPHCEQTVRWYENIPVISFILLRGKCGHCRRPISWRYPLVELLSMVLSVVIARHFGLSWQTLVTLVLTYGLIVLTFIDFKYRLLPDNINLSLLWLGLLVNAFDLFVTPQQAILGALTGYISLWIIAKFFYLLMHKEGMGHGDFKLLATFGAWQGWVLLPLIILIASLLGSIVAVILLLLKKHRRDAPLAFGPYLALAGWISLLWGNQLMQFYESLFYNF